VHKRGVVGYSKKSALLEEAITHMNAGKYGRSSAALKELLALDPHNTEARRLFATLHLRLGSLVTARQAFESLANEAIGRQDFWLAESLLREYLAAGPRCVPFLELLAHVYEEKGDSMAAVAELGKAIDILIEDPDSENPKKPSQLYAKVRELAPASSVAFQFASLFDIQTGEFLVPHPVAPSAVPSLEVDSSQPQDKILATTQESGTSEVMPWEQFDGAPASPEDLTPPSPPSLPSSNPVIESLNVPDVQRDSTPVVPASQELQVPSSESAGSSLEANFPWENILPSTSDLPSAEGEQGAIPQLTEPRLQSDEHHDDGMGNPIGESPCFVVEGVIPNSSEEQAADVGIAITPIVGSPGLSSPMPWEQIENSTIRIEEAALPMVPSSQLDSASPIDEGSVLALSVTAQPESVSDQLASSAPVPEPSESIPTVDSPMSPAVFPAPEVSSPSSPDSTSTAPFSWTTIFDGAWKFAIGTSSSSSPAEFSKPDAISQDAKELGSVQPESAPGPELSAPSTTSIPNPPVSFSDPELSPSPDSSILSKERESNAITDSIRESDLPLPSAVILSEESLRPEGPSTLSNDPPAPFKLDLPVPPLPEQVEPARESEPVSFPSFIDLQPVAPAPAVSGQEPSFPAVTPDVPEPVSTEHDERPISLFQAAAAPPLSAATSDAPSVSPVSQDTLSHWSTGEVEVQPHRPSEKKRNWDKEKGEAAAALPTLPPPAAEESEPVDAPPRGWESAPSEAIAPALEKVVPQEDTRPEWVRASESITFVNLPQSPSATWQDSDIEAAYSKPEPAFSVAASAVDVLFDSTGEKGQIRTQDRVASPRPRPRFAARIARVRIGISSFIGSCFSTTRSIALLCLGLALSSVALVAIGIGVVGLAWMVMEAPPSSVFHNLTTSPPRVSNDSRKNGYFLLLGFDTSAELDPVQAGYERKAEGGDFDAASACMVGDEGKGMMTAGASANVVRGWFTSTDPVAQLKRQSEAIRSWAAQESVALRRYQQWLSMPFEDVGYGQVVSPNCAHILLAHRLYLAEGFAQDLNTGLERLETDMGSWRTALGQSKTLMVKVLAATAVQDDVAIASGLLIRPELDGTVIGRLGKIVRPLDQVELSLRWPMQSHFVWATKTVTTSLKNDKASERPLHVAIAAAMPLPVQRRSNAYADYYEAASKAVAEGRYTSLPKPSSFIRTPAVSIVDYLANPIEHIIGIEPLPSWDPYVGRMVETDARLRLASLQVWIRRGAQEENVLTRLAKAGQAYYDPFTGLPMLVNQQKGVMYSVGQDGKDQEGDPLRDVIATVPKTQSVVIESSRSVAPPRSK
jgi:hypothetical protein